ncbi:MAG: hypothetical protein ACYDHT_07035 [Solirubrobacteraceae bacterium]
MSAPSITLTLTREQAEALVAGALRMPVDLDVLQTGVEAIVVALGADRDERAEA